MLITVDADKCQGHTQCMIFAPGLVDLTEDGHAVAKGDGRVPTHLAEAASVAMQSCPEGAISLYEADAEAAARTGGTS
jgi:ferredoxin